MFANIRGSTCLHVLLGFKLSALDTLGMSDAVRCYADSVRPAVQLWQAQHGAAAIIALCSIAMGVVFAGHKLNCYQLGLSCVHAEGIHDWRYFRYKQTEHKHTCQWRLA